MEGGEKRVRFVEHADDVIEIQSESGRGVGVLHQLPTGEYGFKTLDSGGGYWSGDSLRMIAERLDKLNAESS